MSKLTLGSLFDGSGGFPLGGLISGITPVWSSEIEPFPVMVTSKRLPFVKHYGDVSTLKGGELEPVDIITFGSPCQDMSVAGKREGLDGSRSSLFYEAVRIVKEMSILVICQDLFEKDFDMFFREKGNFNRPSVEFTQNRMSVRLAIQFGVQ